MIQYGRGIIISGFKILSVIALAYMFLNFYSIFKNENLPIKIQGDANVNNNESKSPKTEFFNKLIVCSKDSYETTVSGLIIDSTLYYTFAVFLGAFINVKTIMKFGVI